MESCCKKRHDFFCVRDLQNGLKSVKIKEKGSNLPQRILSLPKLSLSNPKESAHTHVGLAHNSKSNMHSTLI